MAIPALKISKVCDEYTLEPLMEVLVYQLTDAQEEWCFQMLEEELKRQWVPLPVCGGDINREHRCAWIQFDFGCVSIDEGCLRCHITLRPDDPFDALDPSDDGYFEMQEHSWMLALPFAERFIKPMASIQ